MTILLLCYPAIIIKYLVILSTDDVHHAVKFLPALIRPLLGQESPKVTIYLEQKILISYGKRKFITVFRQKHR